MANLNLTPDEILKLVDAIHTAVEPLGYSVGTGFEEEDVFHVILEKDGQ